MLFSPCPPLQMIGVPCSRNGGVIAHTGNDRAAQEVVIYFKSRNAATPHILKRAETVHHSYLQILHIPIPQNRKPYYEIQLITLEVGHPFLQIQIQVLDGYFVKYSDKIQIIFFS